MTGRDGGCTGGKSHTCLLLSDLSLYLHAQLEGSFLSWQLLLGMGSGNQFNPDRSKMCFRGGNVMPVLHKMEGWERMERKSV